MKDVQLVRLDAAIHESVINDSRYMEAMIHDNWPLLATLVHEVVGQKLTTAPLSVDTLDWEGYFVIDSTTREVVGSCAFKGPPREEGPAREGTVEIAYFTFPGFKGNGYATSMARKLIALATHCEKVQRVIAHTLAQTSASTRVLEKSGMTFVGELNDPDDGPIWQWQISTPPVS